MHEGFHVCIDDQDKLVRAIVEPKYTRWLKPVDIAGSLIEFIEYDFTKYWHVIETLYKLPLFDILNPDAKDFEASLDVRGSDFEECRNICRDIAEELENTVGSFFIRKELDLIDARKDNGYASFWLEQARDMVEALRGVITAHTFISRAFDICFRNTEKTLPERAQTFFSQYPDLLDHAFSEVFVFYPHTGGRLNYERTILLTKELGSDFDSYYSVLHKEANSVSIVKGNLMRSHKELLFFSFLELLRRDVRICHCECCGNYFVPRTKKKTLYCDRIIKGAKTCKDVGPKLTQKRQKGKYGAIQEYDRLYKMYYARAERYECRAELDRDKTANNLTYDEFYTWSARAAAARRRYIGEEISREAFLQEIALDIKDLKVEQQKTANKKLIAKSQKTT